MISVQMQHDLNSMTVQLSLLFLSHCCHFLCPYKKKCQPCPMGVGKERRGGKKREKEVQRWWEKEKVSDEGQEALFRYLDTAEAREERTGG